MKKTLALLLVTLLALTTLAPALAAEQLVHENSGITFTVPEGYTAEDISMEDVAALQITDPADENIYYIYELYYDEGLAGLWLEDLDEEQIAAVATVYAEGVGDLSYTVEEANGISYLLMLNEDLTFGAHLCLLDGWVCGLYAVVSEGSEMTEAGWLSLATLQAGIAYAAE